MKSVHTSCKAGKPNLREIYDTVMARMEMQGKASESSNGRCLYRYQDAVTNDVTSCAVGCLIEDNDMAYSFNLRGSVTMLGPEVLAKALGWYPDFTDCALLASLQRAHDATARDIKSGATSMTFFERFKAYAENTALLQVERWEKINDVRGLQSTE